MKTALLMGVALVMLGVSVPAMAQEPELYRHNGSIIEFFWDDGAGETFEGVYLRPRAGLRVAPGTRLIEGSASADGTVGGEAFVFKGGCRPAGYYVTGSFSEDGNTLSVTGEAPIRALNGCQIVGYRNNNNSSLVFKRVH